MLEYQKKKEKKEKGSVVSTKQPGTGSCGGSQHYITQHPQSSGLMPTMATPRWARPSLLQTGGHCLWASLCSPVPYPQLGPYMLQRGKIPIPLPVPSLCSHSPSSISEEQEGLRHM